MSFSRAGAADGRHRCSGMQLFAMQWIPFHRNSIDTIGMDTYGLIAHGTAAAGGGGTRAIWPLLVRDRCLDRGRRRVSGPGEGGETGQKHLLAHARSLRDNPNYRASFKLAKRCSSRDRRHAPLRTKPANTL